MLKAHIVKKRREMLIDVAFELNSGDSLGLFGASGVGKSTVLACIAGVDEPDDGFVQLDEIQLYPPSLPLHRRRLGYLTQNPDLFSHLTVGENVRFGIPRESAASDEQNEWIKTLRESMHLGALWSASAAMISGGQARRVSLARMLARKPPLVLLDEPFAGLDRKLVRELIEDLIFWSKTIGFSMIAVDHQAGILERLCPQRVIVMEQGKIVQRGKWSELYDAPATDLLRSLLAPI